MELMAEKWDSTWTGKIPGIRLCLVQLLLEQSSKEKLEHVLEMPVWCVGLWCGLYLFGLVVWFLFGLVFNCSCSILLWQEGD